MNEATINFIYKLIPNMIKNTPFLLRQEIVVIWSVCLPFLLRFLQSTICGISKKFIYKKCCDGGGSLNRSPPSSFDKESVNPIRATLPIYHREGDNWDHGPSISQITEMNWDEARLMHGYNFLTAFIVSAIRLFFWHILQPVMYIFLLYAYSDILDIVQLVLGLIVGVRELVYLTMTIVALFVSPSFLLVDIGVEKETSSYIFVLLMYTLCPDKYVLGVLGPKCANGGSWHISVFAVFNIMDCCGMAAFITGLIKKSLPIALGIGYFFTTFGGVVLGSTLLISVFWVDCCQNRCCQSRRISINVIN